MKLKRDHGYSHQLRVKHERAMNKYGKNTATKFITKGIYYITRNYKSIWFWKSAHHKESNEEKIIIYFEKFSKLCLSMVSALLLSPRAQEFLVMYSFSFFVFRTSLFLICTKSVSLGYNIVIIVISDKSNKGNNLKCGSKGTNQSSLKWTNQTSCFLRGQTKTNFKKAEWNSDPKVSDFFSIFENWHFTYQSFI